MPDPTPLDRALAAMGPGDNDVAARLAFYERLCDAELFVLLEKEPEGDDIEPRLFEIEAGNFVLVFDLEQRLSAFAEGAAPYAALAGRALVQMLATQELGLALNIAVAGSQYLVPAQMVQWLADMLAQEPVEEAGSAVAFHRPGKMPEPLLEALSAKLALARGMADYACLVRASYADGQRRNLMAIIGARPGAERPLTRAMAETIAFSGLETGAIDVAFFGRDDPICAKLLRVGLRFDLPKTDTKHGDRAKPPAAPGSDPDKPPRLR